MKLTSEASASETPVGEEPVERGAADITYPRDPSADFLERKARMRAEARGQSQNPLGEAAGGFFRGDTTSGAFRPLNYLSRK